MSFQNATSQILNSGVQPAQNPSNSATIDDAAQSERSLVRKHTRQPLHDRSRKSILILPTPGEIARLAKRARTLRPNPHLAPIKEAPVRSLRRKLSPATISEIVRRYEAGEFTTHLSQEYGISKSGLLGLLRAEGVKLRNQPITPEDERRAVELYESGLTIKQVEDKVGYSYGTIRRVLHERGVAVRPSCVRRGKPISTE